MRIRLTGSNVDKSPKLYYSLNGRKPSSLHVSQTIIPHDEDYSNDLFLSELNSTAFIENTAYTSPYFSSSKEPHQIVEAIEFLVDIKPDDEKLKIWIDEKINDPLYISVEYKTSKDYKLSLEKYDNVVSKLSEERRINNFHSLYTRLDSVNEISDFTVSDLENSWLPLMRYILHRKNGFIKDVNTIQDNNKIKLNSSEITSLMAIVNESASRGT